MIEPTWGFCGCGGRWIHIRTDTYPRVYRIYQCNRCRKMGCEKA